MTILVISIASCERKKPDDMIKIVFIDVIQIVLILMRPCLYSVMLVSVSESTPPEEEYNYNLPAEKYLQYAVILAEINRKFSLQNFKPV